MLFPHNVSCKQLLFTLSSHIILIITIFDVYQKQQIDNSWKSKSNDNWAEVGSTDKYFSVLYLLTPGLLKSVKNLIYHMIYWNCPNMYIL